MPEYLHQAPGTEVRFLAGHYTVVEERRIARHGHDLLIVVGIAAVESSCCGVQGCRFINVPGYVVAWKDRLSSGVPASIVEPVEDEAEQAEIQGFLQNEFPYSQILFPS